MSRVILSNGKTFNAAWAGAAVTGNTFAANFPDTPLIELALAFSDQDEITVEEAGFEPRVYTGFTRISELRTMADGSVNMILRKEAGA